MGMPLITEQNATEVAANGCARSTVQETYDFILADLNKAIELLTATTKERDDKRYVSLDVASVSVPVSIWQCTTMRKL